MYVCTNRTLSPHFTELLAGILREEGLEPTVGRVDDSQGGTNFVLDADGFLVKVWAQNMPVDPLPEVDIATYSAGVGTDPNGYIVSVQSWAPFLQSPKPLYERIRGRLTRARMEVHDRPGSCAAKRKVAST